MEKMIYPSEYLSKMAEGAKKQTGWQKAFAKVIHERAKKKSKWVI